MALKKLDIAKQTTVRADPPERPPADVEWPKEVNWKEVYHDYIDWGMFIHGNKVWMKRIRKGSKDEPDTYWFKDITNFSVSIALHMKGAKVASYLLDLENTFGQKERVDCNTDDTVSLASFKKVLRRLGNFDFNGFGGDFDKLWSFLQATMGSGEAIHELGWQKRGRFFAFANAAVNRQVIRYDKYGCFEQKLPDGSTQQYYVPAGNLLHKDDDTAFESGKLIRLVQNDITFKRWAAQVHKVHRQHSMSALCFALATVFSDFIHEQERGFPIWFGYGEASSGKGDLVRTMMALNGDPQPSISLTGKASTDKGKHRMFAEHIGISLFLDEYRNSIPDEMFEFLKGIWDRTTYKRGNIVSRFGTDAVPIRCTAWICGNYYPNADDALLTRLVVEHMDKNSFNADERKEFRLLENMREKGYSGILVEVVRWRDAFEKEWKTHYDAVRGDIDTLIGLKVTQDRMLKNIAILGATYRFFSQDGRLEFPFTYNKLLEHLVHLVMTQEDKRDQGNDVAHFWDCFLAAVKDKKLLEDEHFRIEGDTLTFFWKDVHLAYSMYHYTLYRTAAQSSTVMLDKMRKNPCYIGLKDSCWIGERKSSAQQVKMSAINGFDLAGLLVKRSQHKYSKNANVVDEVDAF